MPPVKIVARQPAWGRRKITEGVFITVAEQSNRNVIRDTANFNRDAGWAPDDSFLPAFNRSIALYSKSPTLSVVKGLSNPPPRTLFRCQNDRFFTSLSLRVGMRVLTIEGVRIGARRTGCSDLMKLRALF